MKKCNVITVSNQKGGVGKTTTTFNLAVALSNMGNKVLVVDSDPQGDLTTCMGFNESNLNVTLADLMQRVVDDEDVNAKSAIVKNSEGVDLIPGNLDLSAIEFSLVNAMSREFVIKNVIKDVKDDYDYILIDSMPSLGMLTINALSCCDKVIIPVQDHFLAAKGMGHLLKTVSRVKKNINPDLKIGGILLTLVNSRTKLSKETTNLLKSNYGSVVNIYDTQIPLSVRMAETSSIGKSIFEHNKNSKVAIAYEEFAKEVVRNERTRSKHETSQDYSR